MIYAHFFDAFAILGAIVFIYVALGLTIKVITR